MESPDMTLQTPMPVSSDAEIRAFLRPLLMAGKPPTYKAMRATLGGGFSRLARIKKQVERELAGDDAVEDPSDGRVVASELVATLEALFERQRKAIEDWERRSLARLEPMPAAERSPSVSKTKAVTETNSAQADRLEAVERRLLAIVDRMHALTKNPAAPGAHTPAANGAVGDVPPAWARQAAAAATAALDGRLHSMEETMRDVAAGGRAALDLAAEIAREVAADASLQLRVARSTLSKVVSEESAHLDHSAVLSGILQTLRSLHGQVGGGFATAAAVADRRAVAIRDVILAMVDIEAAQCEMLEAGLGLISSRRHNLSSKIATRHF